MKENQIIINMQSREIAFLVLESAFTSDKFITDLIPKYSMEERDRRFVQELCYGVMRRKLSLDALAKKSSKKGSLKLKRKEKILLRMAIYQLVYMDRVPPFAIASEMGNLAKKYTGRSFSAFLNALLRNFSATLDSLNLSEYYSFPELFVEKLKKQNVDVRAILEELNKPGKSMYRLRPGFSLPGKKVSGTENMYFAEDIDVLKDTPAVYFQNATQVEGIRSLATEKRPKRILDICSAPGGKLLLLHDLFPEAKLTAVEKSSHRAIRLEENREKYELQVSVHIKDALEVSFTDRFDLIVIDAPCSNTGVLHKRPEARWRITESSIKEHALLQYKLIERAKSFLASGGEIWYNTCSILCEENEEVIEKATKHLRLKIRGKMHLTLPNSDGWDGGFSVRLS